MINLRVVRDPHTAEVLQKSEDSFFDKLIKYIPADIIAAYTAFRATILPDINDTSLEVLPYGGEENYYYFMIAFYFGLVLTPFYKLYMLKHPALSPPYYQAIISMFAFAIWVFTFGDYFELVLGDLYSHKLSALLLIIFTLLTPLIEKIFSKS